MTDADVPDGDASLAAARRALARHGLPDRWRGRARFVACEIGFGDGTRFLAALDAWRRDAQRPRRLDWLAVEAAPRSRTAMAGARRGALVAPHRREHTDDPESLVPAIEAAVRAVHNAGPADPDVASLRAALAAQWPPRVDGRHRIAFEGGAVVLHLAFGDAGAWLRGTEATVDAFLFDGDGVETPVDGTADDDGATDTAKPDGDGLRSLARLAAEGATVSLSHAGRAAREALASAGFALDGALGGTVDGRDVGSTDAQADRHRPRPRAGLTADGGPGAPDDIDDVSATVTPTDRDPGGEAILARDAWPGVRARPRTARALAASRAPRTVAVVGAGIAGAAAARALADEGLEVVLVEALGTVASGTSAVAAGVFHAAIGPAAGVPGAHARLARAAAFEIARDARCAIDAGFASGTVDGVLRVAGADSDATGFAENGVALDAARTRGEASAAAADPRPAESEPWPDDALERRLDATGAAAATGLAGLAGGRWMRFAGTVDPPGLVRAWLAEAGPRVRVATSRAAHALRADGDRWTVLDAAGDAIATVDTVVVAAGTATPALLAPWGAADWPLRRVRGQASRAPAGAWRGQAPRLPLTGHGHVFVDATGGLVFGATSETVETGAPPAHDVRAADHAFNARRVERLLGGSVAVDATRLQGAAGERLVAGDRLPVVGAVPDPAGSAPRAGQPRHVPRVPGLFVCGAFGARGVLWSSLAGRIVAAAVSGGPMPVGTALVDAVDPARFTSRAARRAPPRGRD